MSYHVAVVDIRITNQLGVAGLAAWRAARDRVWVSGSHTTLVVDDGATQAHIVNSILGLAAARGAATLRLDLLCHGAMAVDPGTGAVLGYVAKLGQGLAVSNVRDWAPLSGKLSKIRLFSCGELEHTLAESGAAPPDGSREELCYQIATTTRVPVVSSPNSVVFAMSPTPLPEAGGAGIDAEGWDSPVYRYHGRPRRRETIR